MWMPKYPLAFMFIITAVVVITIAALATNRIIGGLASEYLEIAAEQDTVDDAKHIASLMHEIGFSRPTNRVSSAESTPTSATGDAEQDIPPKLTLESLAQNLPGRFPSLITNLNATGISILDLDGNTVWSSDVGIPDVAGEQIDLFESAADGKVASRMFADTEITGADGVVRSMDVVRTFLPLRETPTGSTIGVVIVSGNTGDIVGAQVGEVKSAVLYTTVAAMGGLFITLLGFIVVAELSISRKNRREFALVEKQLSERKASEEAMRHSEAEAQELARENATMAAIGRIVSSSADLNEVYELFADQVRPLIPFDRIVISVVDPEQPAFVNAYSTGVDIPGWEVVDARPLAGTALDSVVRTRNSLLAVASSPEEFAERFPNQSAAANVRLISMLAVPLISNNEVIGVLTIRSRSPNAYTDRELYLTEQIGAQISGAIANARMGHRQKILEGQLLHAQKMEAVGSLAGGVAHDFNNLLTPILGYAQLAALDDGIDERLRGRLGEIEKAAAKASVLTQQLLAFSRRQIAEPKVINLNSLMFDVDNMLRRLIGEDIELVTLPAQNLGHVKVDPGQMEQVLVNLVLNARDAMPNGGKITIETACVDGEKLRDFAYLDTTSKAYAQVSISDTGTGIPEKMRMRIFEPFFTTKETGKGTGLGLSICYGIVTQNGGHIAVESEQGKGTTFRVYLPIVNDDLNTPDVDDDDTFLPVGNETVMLVEDETSVREMTATVLRRQGYEVLEATNGVDAIRLATEYADKRVDLLLTDVVMPLMGGRELAKKFRDIHPEAKLLYTSGYTDDKIVQQGAIEAGTEFIRKPFTLALLTQKVREVLEK